MAGKLAESIKKIPNKPGVYFFLVGRQVVYIGKATSLRDRVKSYFSGPIEKTRGLRIKAMVDEVTRVDFKETESVLEALLLESALIKKHGPKYNVRERDDKSHYHVVITSEDFPRVLLVRNRDLSTSIDPEMIKKSFGPFPSSVQIKEALRLIRKIFPYRDKCQPGQNKPCFNYQIGLCPGVCLGVISRSDYQKNIRHLILFLQGRKKYLITKLETEMKRAVAKKNFEQAGEYRNQIFALRHIQDVSLIKGENLNVETGFRIEAFDIAHLSGRDTVGVMTVLLGGDLAKDQYRRFIMKGSQAKTINDTANLAELLARRFRHQEWSWPDLIVLDGGKPQLNTAKKFLEKISLSIPAVAVTKDENHRPKDIIGDKKMIKKYQDLILLANFESHRFAINFHQKRRRKII